MLTAYGDGQTTAQWHIAGTIADTFGPLQHGRYPVSAAAPRIGIGVAEDKGEGADLVRMRPVLAVAHRAAMRRRRLAGNNLDLKGRVANVGVAFTGDLPPASSRSIPHY